ncbi:MAG TPA: antibiotic biosynthesis monooxygenase [Burkholderiales bacterium]|nr:antibiotic biosynthesis monooxygenase [Burkholderiales bacterium]
MIHVIAVITAKQGKRGQVLEHFNANVPNVLAEEGCIEYGAAIDAEGAPPIQARWGADTFVVIEKWESLEALKAHAAAPHMAAYAAKTRELIASRVIHILTPSPGA